MTPSVANYCFHDTDSSHCMLHFVSIFFAPVDFVLKDPHQQGDQVKEPEEGHRRELLQVPKPWNKSTMAAFQSIQQNLLVTNPVLSAVLNSWHKDYRYVRTYTCTYMCTNRLYTYV